MRERVCVCVLGVFEWWSLPVNSWLLVRRLSRRVAVLRTWSKAVNHVWNFVSLVRSSLTSRRGLLRNSESWNVAEDWDTIEEAVEEVEVDVEVEVGVVKEVNECEGETTVSARRGGSLRKRVTRSRITSPKSLWSVHCSSFGCASGRTVPSGRRSRWTRGGVCITPWDVKVGIVVNECADKTIRGGLCGNFFFSNSLHTHTLLVLVQNCVQAREIKLLLKLNIHNKIKRLRILRNVQRYLISCVLYNFNDILTTITKTLNMFQQSVHEKTKSSDKFF